MLDLQEIDRTQIPLAGGKGASLGGLSRIEGIRVPGGFCVTTQAFRRIVGEAPAIDDLLQELSSLKPDDRDAIRSSSAELRRIIEAIGIPHDLGTAITRALARFGDHSTFAVRSSATAEDLATASFAGQHDTWLNISGPSAIIEHVRRCWASLFTERAVTYRLRNAIDSGRVQMAVVVQQMVVAQASGVLFTADPVSGNRNSVVVEAVRGLGEALVSGLVNADVYRVRDGEITSRAKQEKQSVLTDAQILRLAQLGRRIEVHFGRPQDIEWCLAGEAFQIVQSRPITTLFPIPRAGDSENRVYLSVGHQQMMTDAMKPLGISMWQMLAARPMHEAGGRLFVDVTQELASPAGRARLLGGFGKADPLIADALKTIVDREFIPSVPEPTPASSPGATPAAIETDSAIVRDLIESSQASIATLRREIAGQSGEALFDFIATDVQELKRITFDPRSSQAIMAGMEAAWWLNDHLSKWLGETNAADVLAQSVLNNVTSEMGLELLHVADVIRTHPTVVTFLQGVERDDFLDALPGVPGGAAARDAILVWLEKYGMRCVGEIDITRPRWSERPTTLVPLILGNVRNFEPGAGQRRFEQGLRAAQNKEREVLERLRGLSDGRQKAAEVERMIQRLRTFAGYREYPKYFIVSRLFAYKHALLKEAQRLVQGGVLRDREDIFFLTFEELRDVVRRNAASYRLIEERREEFRANERLTPPRVLTSEGEVVAGAYRRTDVPAGALVGLAVSAGTIEGRARVIIDPAKADLEPGDILVTPFTDPSWTPVFVSISGLVTEVGGLMTHGAVIAREYGIPAVVGVEHATRSIRDGQRIRVHGTSGYVEIL